MSGRSQMAVEVFAAFGNPTNVDRWCDLVRIAGESQGEPGRRQPRRQRQRRLPPDEVEELVDRFLAGGRRKDLAARFGIHPGTVTAILRRHGLAWERGLSPEQVKEAVRLYVDEEWSLARIGDELGFSAGTVRYALLRSGVRTRLRAW